MLEDTILKNITDGNFTIDIYELFIKKYGLIKVWKTLIKYLDDNGYNSFSKYVIDFFDIGRLYEMGLAIENKYSKKELGKYYTPRDVSKLMAQLLLESSNPSSIADVGCGCGNLIIEVLNHAKESNLNIFNKIKNNIYLYDSDKLALSICVARISSYFCINKEDIHTNYNDFLSRKVKLPNDIFVISNPPYKKITKIDDNWQFKSAISESKDLYVGFIEKIIRCSKKATIVTPQSYIVGNNFSTLRKILYRNGYGEIYSFDNVPGTLFNGKKEGIFNTNTSNGVRASILTFNKSGIKGYRLSHLIRFKSLERDKVINYSYLKEQLGETVQDLSLPLKTFKELEPFVNSIKNKKTISDLIETNDSKRNEKFCIYVSSSARYFIVGSAKKLTRNGIYTLYSKDEKSFYTLYALLNSSYVYLWWRMLDGGILVPKSLLLKVPLPLDDYINDNIISYCKEMIKNENKYLVYKKNAGTMQESIKFPESYRNKLNDLLFDNYPFYLIHSNKEIF